MRKDYDEAMRKLLMQKRNRHRVTKREQNDKRSELKQIIAACVLTSVLFYGMFSLGFKAFDKEQEIRLEKNIEYASRLENRDLTLSELQEIMNQYDDQEELEGKIR